MIGLGSIGRKHLENVVAVLIEHNMKYEIDALRSSHTTLEKKEYNSISQQYYSIDDMPNDYDIIFITNPTSLHYDTIRMTIGKTKHMFIEKPVFDSTLYHVEDLPLKKDGIYYVACPLRHKSILKYVKQNIICKEKILSARIISTSYLPSWRKETDYRIVYSAKKDLGGGVTKDLIHEWDYAVYLFGPPDRVMNLKGHISNLEIDSDDISIYIAEYPNMFLEMHLDYIGHKTERIIQIFTNEKRIDVDLLSDTIFEYQNNEQINKKTFLTEDFYRNEMEYFIDCVEKKQSNINTIQNAYTTLKIALVEE